VFNLLGPLTNPAGARRQVVGVYAPDLVEPIAQALAALGCEHALVAHGAGGLDELTPTGENLVAEVRDGEVTITKVDPREFGAGPGVPADLGGGDASDNAAIVRTVFDGEIGPRRDAVILNAGAALYVAGVSDSLEQGVYAARDAIDDGRATATLDRLIAFTSARADALI
jgi:anthranilate phosphoribosyltransferase